MTGLPVGGDGLVGGAPAAASEYTVLKYPGVDPTGVEDSTAGLQACLDAEMFVSFAPGTYRITGGLISNRGKS